jgi:exopolysaccharide production protein ExoZ
MEQQSAYQTIYNIQIVRGFAALFVCSFHARYLLNDTHKWGTILFENGYLGVQLFFVISGIIMANITSSFESATQSNKKYALHFILNRIVRIAPLYYLFTIAWLVYTKQFIHFTYSDIKSIICTILFFPSQQFPIYFIGWTINYEIYFYILFTLSFCFKKNRYLFISCCIIGFVFLTPFICKLFNYQVSDSNFVYLFFTNFINLYFLAGIFIFHIFKRFKLPLLAINFLCIISIILLSCTYFSIVSNKYFQLFSISLFLFSIVSLPNNQLYGKGKQALIYLGNVSFLIYLVHNFIIEALPKICEHLLLEIPNQVYFVLIIVFTILFSCILLTSPLNNCTEVKVCKNLKFVLYNEQEQTKNSS